MTNKNSADLTMAFDRVQASKITGLAYATITNWANAGFVRPSIQDAGVSGVASLYDPVNLLQLCVGRRLTESGISISEVAPALAAVGKALREDGELADNKKAIGGVVGYQGTATYLDRAAWDGPQFAEFIRARECCWVLDARPVFAFLTKSIWPFIRENQMRLYGFAFEKGDAPGSLRITLADGTVLEGEDDQLAKQLRLHNLKRALSKRRVLKPVIDSAAADDIEDMARFVGYQNAEAFSADIRRVQEVISGEQSVTKEPRS